MSTLQRVLAVVAAAAIGCAGLLGAPAAATRAAAAPRLADPTPPTLPALPPWSQPAAMSGSSTTAPQPDLAATYDGSTAAAVWTTTSGSTVTVQAAGWSGGTLLPTQTLDTATPARAQLQLNPMPAVAVAASAWQGVAVWLDGSDAPYTLKAATWGAGGWSAAVAIAGAGSSAPAIGVQPQVAIADDGSSAIVTWVARGSAGAYDTQGYVYASTWSASSGQWTAGVNLSNDGATQPVAAVAATGLSAPMANATLATVAWTAYNASLGRNQIQYRTLSESAGAGWSAIDAIDNASPETTFDALELTMSGDGRSAALGYTEVGILETSVRAAVVSRAAAPWRRSDWRTRQLSTQNAGNPAVVMPRSGTSVLAVWPQEVGNDFLLLGSAWSPGTGGAGTWTVPQRLTSPTDPDAALPQLAVAPDGSAAALAFCYQAAGVAVASYTRGSGWGSVEPGAAASGCAPQIGLTRSGATTVLAWSGAVPGTAGQYAWLAAASTDTRFSLGTVNVDVGATTGGSTARYTNPSWPGDLVAVLFDGAPGTVTGCCAALTVTTPAHAVGPVDVQILTTLGSATFPSAYTYVPPPQITAVSPTMGPVSGGPITVTGTGLSRVVELLLGPNPVTVDSATDTTARATVPAGLIPGGQYSVTALTVSTGQSNTLQAAYMVRPVPTVTAVSPATGPAGSTVTISGGGLWGTSSVSFGGVAATSVRALTDSVLTATVPPHPAGPVDVTVTTPGGSATAAGGFTYVPPSPVLTGVSPLSGPVAGGTTVTLSGSNLAGTTAVSVGGDAAAFTVVSDSSVRVVTPAHAPGTVGVAVTTSGGTVVRPQAFTYVAPAPSPVVTRVEPASGPTDGGTTVTVVGSGLTGATGVSFGGTPGTGLTVVDDATVTVVTPAHAAGAVEVAVAVPGGSGTLPGGFTFVAPAAPTIVSVAPLLGTTLGGTQVTVTGTGFSHVSQVSFGGVAGTDLRVIDDSTLTVTSPAHAAGAVDVVVSGAAGSATEAGGFTYQQPAPVVAAVSPSSGTAGTPLTIAGDHLTGTTAVTIGGTPATGVTVVDDQTVTAVAPAHAPGTVDVALTAAGGSVTAPSAFTYAAPTLTGIAPPTGTALGGTGVVLTGTALSGVTGVTIGGTAATGVFPVDDATVSVVTPAHDPGAADVTVTVAGGDSVTLTGGYTFLAPPAIGAVSPATGPAAGGQVVAVSGTALAGATALAFGDSPATGLAASGGALSAVTPGGDPGSVDVTVTTPVGQAVAERAYAFVAAPRLDAATPDSGSTLGGTAVTLSGANLMGAGVTIGGATASVVSSTVSSVTVITPPGVAGPAPVTVATVGGTATLASAFSFVTPAPAPTPAPQPPVPPAPVPVATSLSVAAKAAGKGRVRITARATPAYGRSGVLQVQMRRKGRVAWQRVVRTPAWPNRGAAAVRFTVRVPRGRETLRLNLPATARGDATTRTFTVKVR